MRRREFLGVIGGAAAAMPLATRAQQQAMPVIGFLNSGGSAAHVRNVAAFRQGLREVGFTESQNVAIEFRWADNRLDRIPSLAAELVDRSATVMVANLLAVLQVKAATSIPIVFTTGSDPVRDGLVSSLSRPGGNLTGVVFIIGEVGTKRLDLLRQLVPKAATMGMLVHPDTSETEAERRDIQAAARSMNQSLLVRNVQSAGDINAAFETFATHGIGSLLIGTGAFTFNHRDQIVALAHRYAIPAAYGIREAVTIGGLMSYGSSLPHGFHQAGIYAGRILKGEKPADLPVIRSTRFEFVINVKTAKTLGLEVPPPLLALADEVVE